MSRHVVRFVLMLLLAGALPGCAVLRGDRAEALFPPLPPALAGPIPANELQADLDHLAALLEEVHPDPAATLGRARYTAALAALRAEFARPMTRLEAHARFARTLALLGDAHTRMSAPEQELAAARAAGERFLPVRLARAGDAFVSLGGAVPAGSRVRAINGEATATLVDRCVAMTPGEQPGYREHLALNGLAYCLWLLGVRAPFTLELEDAVDRSVVTLEAAAPATQAPPATRRPPYEYSVVTAGTGRIGRLDFRSMAGPRGAFEDFLAATFARIAAEPIDGLVIDLRENGGGDSSLGDRLLDFINDRPYRLAARKEWRSSLAYHRMERAFLPAALSWLPVEWVTATPARAAFRAHPPGQSLVSETALRTPGDNPLRYRGPFAVLIGPRTFSSATMLANGIGDFRLAPLFGEPTGGVPNTFGEIGMFRLPNTMLVLSISSARFVRANGDAADPNPVRPDFPVAREAGRDAALAAAMAWLGSPDGRAKRWR